MKRLTSNTNDDLHGAMDRIQSGAVQAVNTREAHKCCIASDLCTRLQ